MYYVLDYLQGEVKENVDALIVSMTRGLVDNKSFESNNNTVENDINDVEMT